MFNTQIDELSENELEAVVGGVSDSQLKELERQLEKLNPQAEVGKALLTGLETLVKAAEGKLEEI